MNNEQEEDESLHAKWYHWWWASSSIFRNMAKQKGRKKAGRRGKEMNPKGKIKYIFLKNKIIIKQKIINEAFGILCLYTWAFWCQGNMLELSELVLKCFFQFITSSCIWKQCDMSLCIFRRQVLTTVLWFCVCGACDSQRLEKGQVALTLISQFSLCWWQQCRDPSCGWESPSQWRRPGWDMEGYIKDLLFFFFFMLMERRVFCTLLIFVGCTPEHTEPSVTRRHCWLFSLPEDQELLGAVFQQWLIYMRQKILPFLQYVCALRKVFPAVFLAYSYFLSSVEIQEYRAAPLSCGNPT